MRRSRGVMGPDRAPGAAGPRPDDGVMHITGGWRSGARVGNRWNDADSLGWSLWWGRWWGSEMCNGPCDAHGEALRLVQDDHSLAQSRAPIRVLRIVYVCTTPGTWSAHTPRCPGPASARSGPSWPGSSVQPNPARLGPALTWRTRQTRPPTPASGYPTACHGDNTLHRPTRPHDPDHDVPLPPISRCHKSRSRGVISPDLEVSYVPISRWKGVAGSSHEDRHRPRLLQGVDDRP